MFCVDWIGGMDVLLVMDLKSMQLSSGLPVHALGQAVQNPTWNGKKTLQIVFLFGFFYPLRGHAVQECFSPGHHVH